jgi:hypothetical protein
MQRFEKRDLTGESQKTLHPKSQSFRDLPVFSTCEASPVRFDFRNDAADFGNKNPNHFTRPSMESTPKRRLNNQASTDTFMSSQLGDYIDSGEEQLPELNWRFSTSRNDSHIVLIPPSNHLNGTQITSIDYEDDPADTKMDPERSIVPKKASTNSLQSSLYSHAKNTVAKNTTINQFWRELFLNQSQSMHRSESYASFVTAHSFHTKTNTISSNDLYDEPQSKPQKHQTTRNLQEDGEKDSIYDQILAQRNDTGRDSNFRRTGDKGASLEYNEFRRYSTAGYQEREATSEETHSESLRVYENPNNNFESNSIDHRDFTINQAPSEVSFGSSSRSVSGPRPPPSHWSTKVVSKKKSNLKETFKRAFQAQNPESENNYFY